MSKGGTCCSWRQAALPPVRPSGLFSWRHPGLPPLRSPGLFSLTSQGTDGHGAMGWSCRDGGLAVMTHWKTWASSHTQGINLVLSLWGGHFMGSLWFVFFLTFWHEHQNSAQELVQCLSQRAGQEGLREGEAVSEMVDRQGRGTGCAQRETEVSNISPDYKCKAKAEKCCPFSPADFLDSSSALENSTDSPAAGRAGHSRHQEHPDVSQHFCCSLPADCSLQHSLTPQPFWPGPACCWELFGISGFHWISWGGTYPSLLHFMLPRAVSAVCSVTGPGISGVWSPGLANPTKLLLGWALLSH